MKNKCLTTEDLLRRLAAYSLPKGEKMKLDVHLDDCPNCLAALERIGESLAESIMSWSQKLSDCPSFEEIYNTVFDLPDGLVKNELKQHLAKCSSCQEEYDFINASPGPDTVAPSDYKVPDTLISDTLDKIRAMAPAPQAEKVTAKERIESIKQRSSEFLEKLGREAALVFVELAPVTGGVARASGEDEKHKMDGGRHYFVLATAQKQIIFVKLMTEKREIIVDSKVTSPGVIEVYLDSGESYILEVEDKKGVAYDVTVHKAPKQQFIDPDR